MLTQLAAAANMGNRINKTAVEQAQPAAAEIGVHAGSIGAIAIDEDGVFTFVEVRLVIDERHWDFNAVACGHPQVLTAIIFRLKTPDLSLFNHLTLPGVHIQFKQRIRGGHRRIAVPQAGRFRFRVKADPRYVSRVIERNAHHFAGFAVDLADTGQSALTLFHHQPVGKQGEPLQHHLIARGN